jgi:hypothetical protein
MDIEQHSPLLARQHGSSGLDGPALRGATNYRIAVGPQAGRKVFA